MCFGLQSLGGPMPSAKDLPVPLECAPSLGHHSKRSKQVTVHFSNCFDFRSVSLSGGGGGFGCKNEISLLSQVIAGNCSGEVGIGKYDVGW